MCRCWPGRRPPAPGRIAFPRYSFDHGGAWTLAGTSASSAFNWTLPTVSGQCRYYFKVVAVKADGTRIESMVDMHADLFVHPNQKPAAVQGAERRNT